MPVAKFDHGASVNQSKSRKERRSPIKPSAKARERPDLRDVPAVVVRLRGRNGPVDLVNLPMRDNGADMVLHIIAEHPNSCLMTPDLEYIQVADIVQVICPERGELIVDEVRRASVGKTPFRPLQAKLGTRGDIVGIANIPDTPEGRTLFKEILEEFRSIVGGAPSGYTLLTTDYGYIPVWELAKANAP
jgi:hypothetical protein